MNFMNVRKASEGDFSKCIEILSKLSDWFDEKDLQKIVPAIQNLETYIYEDKQNILGFICLKNKNEHVIEIEYMGVNPNDQGRGIGSQLLDYVFENISNGKVLEVKTLDESVNYEPYAKTRRFYEKNRFAKIESLPEYPGWNPGCPCSIYIKY